MSADTRLDLIAVHTTEIVGLLAGAMLDAKLLPPETRQQLAYKLKRIADLFEALQLGQNADAFRGLHERAEQVHPPDCAP